MSLAAESMKYLHLRSSFCDDSLKYHWDIPKDVARSAVNLCHRRNTVRGWKKWTCVTGRGRQCGERQQLHKRKTASLRQNAAWLYDMT